MAPVKVFGPLLSPNVTRVILCLEEVGVEYEIVNVDFDTGEHKSPQHLQRNPFGQLPAFQDGELMLFESRAISRYVLRKYSIRPETDDILDKCISRLVSCILGQREDKTSGVNLLREDNLEETALVDVWLDVEANQYEPTIAPIVYQLILVPMRGGTPDQKLIDDSLEKMKKVLDVYEARLSKFKYLAGDFVSLADLSHFPYTVHFMATPFASVFDSYPRVKAWVQGLLSRPAAQRVISQFPKY